MERFKKIQRWIGSKDEYFKGALVILWMIWAFAQVDTYSYTDRKFKTYDMEMEQAVSRELATFSEKIQKEAEAKGEKYGAKEYFADHKRIEEEWESMRKKYPSARSLELGNYGPLGPHNILMQKLEANRIRGFVKEEDITRESQSYSYWKKAGGAPVDNAIKEWEGLNLASKFKTFFGWFQIFYLRSLPLAFFWYLIAMCKRRGILETFLADKKKFFLALFAWPVLIWLYPSNVIREIRVEAELRRMGNVFRKFGDKERLFIEKIANSDQYAVWLKSYRLKNELHFQRGLLVALLVTIVFSIAAPVFCHDFSASGVDPPGQSQTIVQASHHDTDHGSRLQSFAEFAIPEAIFRESFWQSAKGFMRISKKTILQEFVRCIEHVPIFGSLANGEVFHSP